MSVCDRCGCEMDRDDSICEVCFEELESEGSVKRISPSDMVPGDWLLVDMVRSDLYSDHPVVKQLNENIKQLDDTGVEVWCHQCHDFIGFTFERNETACQHGLEEARKNTQNRSEVLKERISRKKKKLDQTSDQRLKQSITLKLQQLTEAFENHSD